MFIKIPGTIEVDEKPFVSNASLYVPRGKRQARLKFKIESNEKSVPVDVIIYDYRLSVSKLSVITLTVDAVVKTYKSTEIKASIGCNILSSTNRWVSDVMFNHHRSNNKFNTVTDLLKHLVELL